MGKAVISDVWNGRGELKAGENFIPIFVLQILEYVCYWYAKGSEKDWEQFNGVKKKILRNFPRTFS